MKLIFAITVVIVTIYLGVELVPPYYSNYQFEDEIKNIALLATNDSQSESVIRDAVYKKAVQFDIPITKDQIKVHRVGTMGTGSVSIDAPYTVHLDLVGYSTDLSFDAATINKGAFQ
ncbi:MAG TPA: hypothetical protein VMH85_19115 [Terriglobales bacterium]|nr:hypothetical protein [Terriglobales bacterium]